jgi:hypothetical protein
MNDPATFFIQVKEQGAKKAKLLGSGGRITTLRLHAVIIDKPLADVQAYCEELARDNPGFTFTPRSTSA